MARYVIKNTAGSIASELVDRVRSYGPITIHYSGVWEVTVLDEEQLLEHCRLWGVFETEKEAAVACAGLSDRMASTENDTRRFIVGGIPVEDPLLWAQVGFELVWIETDD